jgi:MFS family permease
MSGGALWCIGRLRRLRTADWVLTLLCAMYFLLYVDRVNIATAATSLQTDLGLSNTELGLAFSAFAYPYAFFQIFGGWIGDRFGAKRTLIVCGLIVAVATTSTGLAGGLASLFLARLVLGFGEGACFPTATRAMANWLPESAWGYAQGITHSAARLGNAATPPLIAALIVAASWRVSFLALGVASLAWVVAWAWYFRDEPASHPGVRREELRGLTVQARGASREPVPWKALVRRMLPVTAVDFCYGWTLWMFLNWLPAFFQKSWHLDLTHSAVFSAGVFLAGVVGDTCGGLLSDAVLRRTGRLDLARGGVIAAGMLGSLGFLLVLFVTHDIALVALALAAAFFCAELVVAPIWSVPMDIAPRHAGKASGLMNLGFGLAGIVSPFAVGAVIDATGSRTLPFLFCIVLLLAGAILTIWMDPDRKLVEDEPASVSRKPH